METPLSVSTITDVQSYRQPDHQFALAINANAQALMQAQRHIMELAEQVRELREKS